MNFFDCLFHCANNKELVSNFDRLTGHNLSLRGSNLDLAIDKATGRLDSGLADFIDFVRDVIWNRLPDSAKEKCVGPAAGDRETRPPNS